MTSLGSATLILVPTPVEHGLLDDLGGFPTGSGRVEVCGFGPVAAAARTAQRLALLRPRRVLLLGIAGTLDPERRPVGSAALFGHLRLDGVGAGQGEAHRPAEALGFPQWPGDPEAEAIGDQLVLDPGREEELLTVCAAAASPVEASQRRQRHPGARAEDMEAFGVGLACRLQGVPLRVVRGISNVAGDRERTSWDVPGALAAARSLAVEHLDERWDLDR
jgi:futalosine hydrolase